MTKYIKNKKFYTISSIFTILSGIIPCSPLLFKIIRIPLALSIESISINSPTLQLISPSYISYL